MFRDEQGTNLYDVLVYSTTRNIYNVFLLHFTQKIKESHLVYHSKL